LKNQWFIKMPLGMIFFSVAVGFNLPLLILVVLSAVGTIYLFRTYGTQKTVLVFFQWVKTHCYQCFAYHAYGICKIFWLFLTQLLPFNGLKPIATDAFLLRILAEAFVKR
jgi:hypothetical protein